jgi:hypothetical protein
MSTQVQYRRGTGSQNDAFIGALAEITVDTTNLTLRVHDGIIAGGSNLATVTYVNNAIGSLSANSITDGTSNVKIASTNGNVTVSVGGTSNVAVFTSTSMSVIGNITSGNLITDGLVSLSSITKTGSNGVGNIGAETSTFNTIFAKATSAQYADVAEKYRADTRYLPGTVLIFGGNQEVTASNCSHADAIAGVVSTDPAYTMNSGLESEHVVTVALLGRVPCQVVGTIRKGQCVVASDQLGIATALDPDKYQPGCIVGKALEDYNSNQPGTIEVVVGRL